MTPSSVESTMGLDPYGVHRRPVLFWLSIPLFTAFLTILVGPVALVAAAALGVASGAFIWFHVRRSRLRPWELQVVWMSSFVLLYLVMPAWMLAGIALLLSPAPAEPLTVPPEARSLAWRLVAVHGASLAVVLTWAVVRFRRRGAGALRALVARHVDARRGTWTVDAGTVPIDPERPGALALVGMGLVPVLAGVVGWDVRDLREAIALLLTPLVLVVLLRLLPGALRPWHALRYLRQMERELGTPLVLAAGRDFERMQHDRARAR
ncbi:MAG: hypothetical protein MUE41_01385 [Gemmatimonadaceae bacterium]|jgi:hypothetical protein|nr:hypothetical protein [Gemmatimonadaceae bacterium]